MPCSEKFSWLEGTDTYACPRGFTVRTQDKSQRMKGRRGNKKEPDSAALSPVMASLLLSDLLSLRSLSPSRFLCLLGVSAFPGRLAHKWSALSWCERHPHLCPQCQLQHFTYSEILEEESSWPSSSLFAKSQVTGNLQELATPNPIGQLQVARHRAQVPACSTGTSGWRRPCEKGLDHSRSPRGFLEPSFCCLHTFQCLFCSSFSMFSRHYLGQLEKVVSEAKDKHHFIPEALQVPFLYPLLCAAQNQTWNFIW